MTATFLVGGPAFLAQLRQDMAVATDHVFVQAMTFEMDGAGQALVEAFRNSPARDQRLMVDAYSECVINDCMMVGFLKKTHAIAVQDEYQRTQSFMRADDKKLQKKFINPLGFLWLNYPCRNHKKIIVIDRQIAYIGGINFSEHNFEWQDFMLRLDDPHIVSDLYADFVSTWEGSNRSVRQVFGETALCFLDGIRSFSFVQDIIQKIRTAKHSIWVLSPYLSPPFLTPLTEAAKRGVSVTIVAPANNNKPLFTALYIGAFRGSGVKIMYVQGMHHFKGMLIDDKTLFTGSFNFDFVSCCFEQEIVLETTDPDTLDHFKREVLAPVMREAVVRPKHMPSSLASVLVYYGISWFSTLLFVLARLVFVLRNGERCPKG